MLRAEIFEEILGSVRNPQQRGHDANLTPGLTARKGSDVENQRGFCTSIVHAEMSKPIMNDGRGTKKGTATSENNTPLALYFLVTHHS